MLPIKGAMWGGCRARDSVTENCYAMVSFCLSDSNFDGNVTLEHENKNGRNVVWQGENVF